MNQIGGADVAPVHGVMDRRDRVVLKKDVIPAVNPAEPIRIVEPSALWPDVQDGEAGIGNRRNVPDG